MYYSNKLNAIKFVNVFKSKNAIHTSLFFSGYYSRFVTTIFCEMFLSTSCFAILIKFYM